MSTTNDGIHLGGLPRSVLWRIRLGLLQAPPNNSVPVSLDQVVIANQSLLQDELAHYQQLQAMYQPHCTAAKNNGNTNEPPKEPPKEQQEEDADVTETSLDRQEDATPLDNSSNHQQQTPAAGTDNPLVATAMDDPLTAMFMEQESQEKRRQELDLQYRKEKARRKRGITAAEKVVIADCDDPTSQQPKPVDKDTLDIIDKDLHRLPSPDITTSAGGNNSNTTSTDKDSNRIPFPTRNIVSWECEAERATWLVALKELLYVFAQENPNIGYRQGMHEIASYLWLALQLDRQAYLEQSQSQESTTATEESSDPVALLLFDRASSYRMLRSILSNIRQAFDVKVASNSRPLEDMAYSILAKLHQQHAHFGVPDRITPLLQSLSVPPQLYCTKWIRLVFSREVVGAQNVILLWDVFIRIVSEGWEWMAVLESAAAARILLCRDQLFGASGVASPFQSHQQELANAAATDPHTHHHAMNLLMNMSPMQDIQPLVQQLQQLLELQKYQQQHQHQQQQQQLPLQQSQQQQRLQSAYSSLTGAPPPPQHNMLPPHVNANALYQQQQQQRRGLLGNTNFAAAFNLDAVKNSLEQGVERLSTSGATWRSKLGESWNELQTNLQQQQQQQQQQYLQQQQQLQQTHLYPQHQQPLPVSAQNHRIVDTALFNDDDDDEFEDITRKNPQGNHQLPLQQPPPQQPSNLTALYPLDGAAHGTAAAAASISVGFHQSNPPPPNSFAPTAAATPGNTPVSTTHTISYHPAVPQVPVLDGSYFASATTPQELAYRLGKSASVLQDFVMAVARNPAPSQQQQQQQQPPMDPLAFFTGGGDMVENHSGSQKVPSAVWEALAEVESVRTILLQQKGQHS